MLVAVAAQSQLCSHSLCYLSASACSKELQQQQVQAQSCLLLTLVLCLHRMLHCRQATRASSSRGCAFQALVFIDPDSAAVGMHWLYFLHNLVVWSCVAAQEAKRDLPRGWHLVGAMGCDFTHNFPPPLPSGPIRQFLELAQGETETSHVSAALVAEVQS